MKCPVCREKLDIDMKGNLFKCQDCQREKLGQVDRRSSELETWLRCIECKQLTRHARTYSNNPRQLYICQECGETRMMASKASKKVS